MISGQGVSAVVPGAAKPRPCSPARADDPRTILVWKHQLRVQVLPVLLFSGGHVAFVQHTPWR